MHSCFAAAFVFSSPACPLLPVPFPLRSFCLLLLPVCLLYPAACFAAPLCLRSRLALLYLPCGVLRRRRGLPRAERQATHLRFRRRSRATCATAPRSTRRTTSRLGWTVGTCSCLARLLILTSCLLQARFCSPSALLCCCCMAPPRHAARCCTGARAAAARSPALLRAAPPPYGSGSACYLGVGRVHLIFVAHTLRIWFVPAYRYLPTRSPFTTHRTRTPCSRCSLWRSGWRAPPHSLKARHGCKTPYAWEETDAAREGGCRCTATRTRLALRRRCSQSSSLIPRTRCLSRAGLASCYLWHHRGTFTAAAACARLLLALCRWRAWHAVAEERRGQLGFG